MSAIGDRARTEIGVPLDRRSERGERGAIERVVLGRRVALGLAGPGEARELGLEGEQRVDRRVVCAEREQACGVGLVERPPPLEALLIFEVVVAIGEREPRLAHVDRHDVAVLEVGRHEEPERDADVDAIQGTEGGPHVRARLDRVDPLELVGAQRRELDRGALGRLEVRRVVIANFLSR